METHYMGGKALVVAAKMRKQVREGGFHHCSTQDEAGGYLNRRNTGQGFGAFSVFSSVSGEQFPVAGTPGPSPSCSRLLGDRDNLKRFLCWGCL